MRVPQCYRLKDAAKVLGFSESQLRRFVEMGELQAIRVHVGAKRGSIRFTERALNRFIRRHQTALAERAKEATSELAAPGWWLEHLRRVEQRQAARGRRQAAGGN